MKSNIVYVARRFYNRIEQNIVLTSIRQGMLLALPIIMTGSIALLLMSIPIPIYKEWLTTVLDGSIYNILSIIHSITLGCVSLVFLITISLSYESLSQLKHKGIVPLVSLGSYIAFVWGNETSSNTEFFQSTWLFQALICVIISSMLFVWLQKHMPKAKRSYTDGEDELFQYVYSAVVPAAIVISLFAIINVVLFKFFDTSNIQNIIFSKDGAIFDSLGKGLGSGVLFVFLLHFMWSFGIHGGNVLDDVARNVFNSGLDINIDKVANGELPTEVISKSFLDTFALFGGCGAILCMIIAILALEKRRGIRRLTKVATLPALFNMNELLLFGLPIVLNPVYLIPFILTPIVLTIVSYTATIIGLVPYVTSSVEWTTPIFLSGYVATGSIAGSILQLFNLIVGTAIYVPFVIIAQKTQKAKMASSINELTSVIRDNEECDNREYLTQRTDSIGATAKVIASNLSIAIENGEIEMYYQPQVDERNNIIGAEALLRWRYSTGQFLYPPLVIALAEETKQMNILGDFIVTRVCSDIKDFQKYFGDEFVVSMNLTASQITDGNILNIIMERMKFCGLKGNQLGIELTEQTSLKITPEVRETLEKMRKQGYFIYLDDFGMGHNSIMYLRENRFDYVKLDGKIVKDIIQNKRSRDIISSIINLSKTLDFKVVAEYVETEEHRDILEDLGCNIYQGYLYSKAENVDDFMVWAKKHISLKTFVFDAEKKAVYRSQTNDIKQNIL